MPLQKEWWMPWKGWKRSFNHSFSSSPRFFFRLFLTHSVKRYSIWPLMDLNSSSAHRESSSKSSFDMRRGTCFFSAISVDSSSVQYRICFLAGAEYYQKVGDHLSLSLFIKIHDSVILKLIKCHLNH